MLPISLRFGWGRGGGQGIEQKNKELYMRKEQDTIALMDGCMSCQFWGGSGGWGGGGGVVMRMGTQQ